MSKEIMSKRPCPTIGKVVRLELLPYVEVFLFDSPKQSYFYYILFIMIYQQASRVFCYMKSWMKWDYIPHLHLPNGLYVQERTNYSDELEDESDILALADVIKTHAETLARYAKEKKIRPSLAANGESLQIAASDKHVLQAKSSLLFAIKSLQSLVKGPLGILMDIGVCHSIQFRGHANNGKNRRTRSSAFKLFLAFVLRRPCMKMKNSPLRSSPTDAGSM